jgi:flagellar biogenesis protein FliO
MAQAMAGSTALASTARGITGWLLERLSIKQRPRPRLALLERIPLAPRQSLALVEAEGRRFLVATSAEGGPAFYPLDDQPRSAGMECANGSARSSQQPPTRAAAHPAARVSW